MAKKKSHNPSWYLSRQGLSVSVELQAQIQAILSKIFGYHAIEIGMHTETFSLLTKSRIKNNFKILSEKSLDNTDNTFVAEPEFLPVVVDNIDLVIASHVFESSKYPHQVLREIDRILVPEGHFFLIGFNPFSLLGLLKVLRLNKKLHGKQVFRSIGKMKDWLEVLGFEIIDTHTYGYRPSIEPEKLFNSLAWFEKLGMRVAKNFGGVYVIHARKTEFAKIPTIQWKTKKVLTREPAITAVSKQGNNT